MRLGDGKWGIVEQDRRIGCHRSLVGADQRWMDQGMLAAESRIYGVLGTVSRSASVSAG